MSFEKKRSKEPCVRCGAVVRVPVSEQAEVYCVDCRPSPTTSGSATHVSPAEDPVPLSVDDILTITCQLCRSSLLVNESKVGTEVTCPDCHSKTVVTRPKKKTKRSTGRPQPKTTHRSFDPDAELTLEEPFERPKVEHSPDLDDLADTGDDLLSAPLPEIDPLPEISNLDDDLDEAGEDVDPLAGDPAMTRRQRYERMQQRMISEGREQMRKRARKKLAAQKAGSELVESDADDETPRRKKRRRRRKGQAGREARTASWMQPAFGWLRQRSLIVGWVLAAGCLSVPYTSEAQWSPLVLLDKIWQMAIQSPPVLDLWLIVNLVLLIVGTVLLYFVCGRSFAANAELASDPRKKLEVESKVELKSTNASSWFTTVLFAVAWLLAGLPFLYWSILVVPAQFLIVPPLLIGGWLNQSIWKFVLASGFVHPEQPRSGRRLWRNFYGQQVVAALIMIPAVLMIRTGGASSVIGCFLMGGVMIGMAGICGRHCRQLSNSLEPSA